MVKATRTDPRDSDQKMPIRISDEAAHPRIVGMDVRFVFEVLGLITSDLVQSFGREGIKDAHCGAIEFCSSLSGNDALTEAEFGAIREIDFLRWRRTIILVFKHNTPPSPVTCRDVAVIWEKRCKSRVKKGSPLDTGSFTKQYAAVRKNYAELLQI